MLKEISLYCEVGSAVYSAKPIVDALRKEGVVVYLYTSSKTYAQAKDYLGLTNSHIIKIESLTSKWRKRVDFVLKTLLVNAKFSSQYDRMEREHAGVFALIKKIAAFLPKPPIHKVNKIYNRVWSLLNQKPTFKTKDILLFTRSNYSYLLNNRCHRIFTVMESWDHPLKSPFFVKSQEVFTWNEDLAKDIIVNQGERNVHSGMFPLKFRYLEEYKSGLCYKPSSTQVKEEVKFIMNNKYLLYVCTYFMSSKAEKCSFSHELSLIQMLSDVAKKMGLILYVKPHPSGTSEEFKSINNIEHVHVGLPALQTGLSYIFHDDDQYYRYLLLKNAEVVINIGTTIVLEAAYVNKHILQIQVDDSFEPIKKMIQNYHIKKYLNQQLCSEVISDKDSDLLYNLILNISDNASIKLKSWLQTDTVKESTNRIVQCVLKNSFVDAKLNSERQQCAV